MSSLEGPRLPATSVNIAKTMIKVLEIDNLILKTYFADVSTGCSSVDSSSPPQGEMNLDWVRLYIFIGYLRGQSVIS